MSEQDKTFPRRPSWLQVIGSVLAAAFGVQSSANRERDFTAGSGKIYIIAGMIFTLLFIIALVTIVNLVIGSTGR
jgi:hypothetical protein